MLAGHWKAEDMTQTLQQLRQEGVAPRVCMARDKIVQLQVTVGEEPCIIRPVPKYAHLLERWCTELGLEYHGCGVASTSFHVIQELLKKKRRNIGAQERQEVLEASEGLCYICGSDLGDDWQCEHVMKLSRQTLQQEEVIKATCQECHKEKTAKESIDDSGWQPFTSVFCRYTYDQFCRTQREPPLNLRCGKPHRGTNVEVDLRRCRRNCLQYPGYG